MAGECLTIKGLCTVRATKLNPVTGAVADEADNFAVIESQVSLQLTADIEEGTEEVKKNGCGQIQATDRADDIFKRWTLALAVAKLEPAFVEILTGTEIMVDGSGDPIGVIGANELAPGFTRPLAAVEFWTKMFDGDAQSPTHPYGYLLLPASKWRLGDLALGEEFTDVPLAGVSQTNSFWGNGPYDDTGIADQISTWAIAMLEDTNPPPDSFCGYDTIPTGS